MRVWQRQKCEAIVVMKWISWINTFSLHVLISLGLYLWCVCRVLYRALTLTLHHVQRVVWYLGLLKRLDIWNWVSMIWNLAIWLPPLTPLPLHFHPPASALYHSNATPSPLPADQKFALFPRHPSSPCSPPLLAEIELLGCSHHLFCRTNLACFSMQSGAFSIACLLLHLLPAASLHLFSPFQCRNHLRRWVL